MIELDGSIGEGGGQILRSALTLSMITGQAFGITNIRANRSKPGLLRQHLVAVQAAKCVSNATVTGDTIGSTSLTFAPERIQSGDYEFAIGSAGSCTLVLQTLLPALLFARDASSVRITGGTHNPMAPPAHFLQRAWCRAMAQMGAHIELDLKRFGFYPAGGGEITARVQPCGQLRPTEWMTRGERVIASAESFIAGVPPHVAKRELECIGAGMGWEDSQLLLRGLPSDQGPGNVLMLTFEHEHVTEVIAAFGEKAVRAEAVAQQALRSAKRYLASGAAVGEHLADQLMLPLALAGAGRFTTECISTHAKTNALVIERFLPVEISLVTQEAVPMVVVRAR
jgi:RNA 3'-terminal phosphate cyclase (ATP)